MPGPDDANLRIVSDGQKNPSGEPRVAAIECPQRRYDPEAVGRSVDRAIAALSLSGSFVQPADRVVLKPNWVKEHDERFPGPVRWEHVVTHPTVIEAVARWAAA